MLIQKIFHLRLGLLETKSCLATLQKNPGLFEDVALESCNGEGPARCRFVMGNGFHAQLDLILLPSDDPDRTLFRSSGGNVEVAGMVEFLPIRENVTEVQLTIEYTIKSPVHRLLDTVTASVDRFLNKHLRRIEAHVAERSPAPQAARPQRARVFFHQPQLAH